MTEDRWTSADDDTLRAALMSLRADVEAHPLPDVRFVKARGNARRNRRRTVGAAAAAVAVAALGYGGWHQADTDASVLRPAGPAASVGAPTSSSSPNPSQGTTPSPGPSDTPSHTKPTTSETVYVAGPRPLLDRDLFVAPSDWSSAALAQGAPTRSVTTDWEGGAALTDCDADTAQDGTPGAGRFGLVTVGPRGDGPVIGKQRVRLTEDAGTARAERDRLVQALRTCEGRVQGMTVTPDPQHDAAFRLDFDNPYGGPVLTTWVVVTTQRTTGAVSTFAITGEVADDAGFGELQRLVGLAQQR